MKAPLLLTNLFALFLLFLRTSQACLLFTGTLTGGTYTPGTSKTAPLLRAKLIDNRIPICSIALRTNFSPKLTFSCIPGYKAWTNPEVTTIWFEKDKLFSRYSFGNISRKEWTFWEAGGWAESMQLLEAANYGCAEPERQLAEVRGF